MAHQYAGRNPMKLRVGIISVLLSAYMNVSTSNELKIEIKTKNEEIKKSLLQAKSNNALWRDTHKLYLSAQNSILEEDYHQANELLDTVLHQLNTAHQQALKQSRESVIPMYLRK